MSKGLMGIYQRLVHHYNGHLKYVVYASPKLKSILLTNEPVKEGNRNFWIYGLMKRHIIKRPQENLLGYIGVLRKGQGLEIVFESLKSNPLLNLEIIGEGPALADLKRTVSALDLQKRVTFYGLVQQEDVIVNIVKRWQIGLAPYDPSKQNMTYYTEPSKIKFYLEYRLPIIMTKITYIAKVLEKYQAGVCIDYTSTSLNEAIVKIQRNYGRYTAGVDKLIDIYEYHSLYDKQFKFFEHIF
jgi:glycosyltransferase involved in cell wall biosynthesis